VPSQVSSLKLVPLLLPARSEPAVGSLGGRLRASLKCAQEDEITVMRRQQQQQQQQ
jgi:hypothetical protein